jgi:hypothetical protein
MVTIAFQALYEKSLSVKSAVPHPRILGVIRECGGKAHLQDHSWSKAYEDFWEAFKNYDEGTYYWPNASDTYIPPASPLPWRTTHMMEALIPLPAICLSTIIHPTSQPAAKGASVA